MESQNCEHENRIAIFRGQSLCSTCYVKALRREWYPRPGEIQQTEEPTIRVVRLGNGESTVQIRGVMVKYPNVKDPLKSVWTPTRVRPFKNLMEKHNLKRWWDLKEVEIINWGKHGAPSAADLKPPAPKKSAPKKSSSVIGKKSE